MLLQGGLTVRHRAHNPKISGSIPLPARNFNYLFDTTYLYIYLYKKYNTYDYDKR